MKQNTQDQRPRTKEAAAMSDESERSVASDGSVGEPVAWAALREDGSVCACHHSRDLVAAVAGDRQIVELWLRSRNSFLSTEPVAYCVETPLHGWEIASRAAAAAEPELRWRAMVTLTDAERDDICVWLAECLRQASTATEGCNEELAERWQGRAKRAAAMIERLGGEG